MQSVWLLVQFLLFLLSIPLIAQTGPGGVGNSSSNEIWLIAEENCYTDAGATLGSNGSNIQQWNDISGNSNNAIQTNNVFKPNLNTNALNGFSTLTFNGTTDRILSAGVTSNSQVTILVVVQFNSLNNNNDGVIQGSPAGTAFSTAANNKSIGMWINRSNGRIWGRGVQTNNSQRNISQTTTLSTGQFYIITQDYNGSSINQFVDGSAAGTITYNNTLKSWSDFGIGRQGNESLDGDLAELIVHRVSLNSAQRIITENYLAAKYGLTLTLNDVYDEDNTINGNYDQEVTGIGRVDASNIHNDAQGTGIVRILNPTGLNDDEFLMWGHDDGLAQATETSDVPAGVQARFDRVWRVSEVNTSGTAVNVGAVDMRFDLNGLGAIIASDLRLLIDDDNDSFFNDETPISGATDLGGGIYEFQNVPGGAGGLRNNSRFTLGTSNVNQTPLPIELVFFNVKNFENRKVKLEWQTATELNNDFFTIEKSANARDWKIIQTVEGAGNSSALLNYYTIDESPYMGVSYYRLKQTDFNGEFEYSNIKSVTFNLSEKEVLHLYPNPTDYLITITGKQMNQSSIQIINSLGQNVTTSIHINTENEAILTLDLSNLSKGLYFIKTKTSSYKVYKR